MISAKHWANWAFSFFRRTVIGERYRNGKRSSMTVGPGITSWDFHIFSPGSRKKERLLVITISFTTSSHIRCVTFASLPKFWDCGISIVKAIDKSSQEYIHTMEYITFIKEIYTCYHNTIRIDGAYSPYSCLHNLNR